MRQADDCSETGAPSETDAECADDAARVRAFVRRHFSVRGAMRTHRLALGPDLLRAPINVLLAPVFILVRLSALLLTRLGLRRIGGWLVLRRVLLRLDVSRAIESALISEVLHPRDPQAGPSTPAASRLIEDYVGVRSAVAEIVTTSIVLCLGVILFRAATPGVLSLAPILSDRAAAAGAIAEFPLGSGLGRVWYGVFPVDPSGGFVVGVARPTGSGGGKRARGRAGTPFRPDGRPHGRRHRATAHAAALRPPRGRDVPRAYIPPESRSAM